MSDKVKVSISYQDGEYRPISYPEGSDPSIYVEMTKTEWSLWEAHMDTAWVWHQFFYKLYVQQQDKDE